MRSPILLLFTSCAAASTPSLIRGAERLPLAAAEGDAAVVLLFDPRITPQVLANSWGNARDDDFTRDGYAPTELAVFAKDGRVLSHVPLPQERDEVRRLARIERVTIAGVRLIALTVDYSEAAGSFSGDITAFYEAKNNRLQFLETTLPDGSAKRRFSWMRSLKSQWRLSSDTREILAALTDGGGDDCGEEVCFENLFTRVAREKGRWVRHEKHVRPERIFDFEDGSRVLERSLFD